ncbi:MAG: hypothetical protein IJP48_07355 [Synergistaceae bacterium]|nr:hypothetical protein [Synergistaceae bacterium]
MRQRLLDILKRETYGEIYRGHYYAPASEDFDSDSDSKSKSEIIRVWRDSAEISQTKKYIDLSSLSEKYSSGNEQILTYFLDGSRRIIKAGEIAYGNSRNTRTVYPVMAGQIGVGYCKRVDKKLIPEKIYHEIVIALPDIADPEGKNNGFIESIALKLSQSDLMQRLNLEVAKILKYSASSKTSSLQDKATAVIQSRMLELEQKLTEDLTRHRKLGQNNFLVKDGSLEYMNIKKSCNLNYRWVIGISKSFNPEICVNPQGKSDSGYIADIPVNHRTPVARFTMPQSMGASEFAVWYIRLYDRSRTASAFEGVIKVEKMLITDSERNNGLESDFIDTLSAYILNERNPVCYGKDKRWASHIYPVYLTESYIKSRYISTESFINLF